MGGSLHRLFVAVHPPPRVCDELEALPRTEQPGVRWTARHHWHVTLRFLGRAVPDEVIAAIGTWRPSPHEIELGPEITRLGRAVVLPAEGLDDVAEHVRTATGGLGDADDRRPFSGHLTLARLKRKGARCDLVGHPLRARFPVETVELISSETTADGPIYTTMHRWPVA